MRRPIQHGRVLIRALVHLSVGGNRKLKPGQTAMVARGFGDVMVRSRRAEYIDAPVKPGPSETKVTGPDETKKAATWEPSGTLAEAEAVVDAAAKGSPWASYDDDTIKEIKAELDGIDTGRGDDLATVLAYETANKSRSSLIEWLEREIEG